MFAEMDLSHLILARAYSIGGQEVPEWLVWTGGAILGLGVDAGPCDGVGCCQ